MLPTLGQSGPGSNGNEGVLRIPQSPSITGTSPTHCLVSYTGHSLGGGVSVFYSPSWLGKRVYIFEILAEDCEHLFISFYVNIILSMLLGISGGILVRLEYPSKHRRLHQGLDYIIYSQFSIDLIV